MKILIANDHRGINLKNKVQSYLIKNNYIVENLGTDSLDSVDYPNLAFKLGEKIDNDTLGILICGTGIGMSMAANKHHGIRAALCSDTYSARLTRMHNDANVLCIGALVVGSALALDIVDSFVGASFEGGRHKTRVDMFMALENTEK